jgi:HNH endonuclease
VYNNANCHITTEIEAHIKRCISYNPETGLLTWVEKYSKYSKCNVGDTVGTLNSKLAWHFSFCDKDFLSHRVAWFLYYGVWPQKFIDHKDKDPTNNKLINLREANRVQNSANRKPSYLGSSKYLGVCYSKATNKWQVSIGSPRKYLGQFTTEKEAALVYNTAAKEIYGDFAALNIIK